MIIKFLSRKSNSAQLIQYALRYILDEEKCQIKRSGENIIDPSHKLLIRHNLRSRTLKGFIREFAENESFRLIKRKDSVKLFHTILSFGTNDRELVTDNILKDIAKKFISERGANCLYLGAKHEDRGHIHLHLVSSGTQLNGRSARISNEKFRSIKISLDRYQRGNYPFLINSLPNYANEKKLSKDVLISSLTANRQTNKAELLKYLEVAFSKSSSQSEFIETIRGLGHETYSRNGKLQGVLFDGKTKFRFNRLGFSPDRLQELDSPIKTLEGCGLNSMKNLSIDSKNVFEEEKIELSKLETLNCIRVRSQEKEMDYEPERVRIPEVETGLSSISESSEILSLPSPIRLLPLPLKKET